MATREELKAVATTWMRDLWQKGNTSAVDKLHVSDFVDHSPAGRDSSNEGFKDAILQTFTAFPDFHTSDYVLVIDTTNSSVAIRWKAQGKHQGAFFGVAPTGRTVVFRGIEILRIVDGRVTERWGEWDGLDLMDQLGAPVIP